MNQPRPRRVLHLVSTLHTGGTESQLVALLRAMDRERFEPRLACFHVRGELLETVRGLGIDPIEISIGPSLMRPHTVAAVAQLARLAREVDLVHCHDVYAIILGIPAAHLAHRPVIAARRDLGHHVGRLQGIALRHALAHATMVLANALNVAARLERDEGVPARRIAVVPNGIDLRRFDRSSAVLDPSHPALPMPGPIVATVARMTHPAKGHDDLLEAAALVKQQVPDVHFVLAGNGPREEELRDRAGRLGLADTVHFLGLRLDVPALLAHTSAVCHPSRAEGMPNAVIEAMAARRPVVATSVGGVPELIQDGVHGRLVPAEDPPALAGALLELLTDPTRAAAYASAARARVEEHLTIDRLAERTASLYETLLA